MDASRDPNEMLSAMTPRCERCGRRRRSDKHRIAVFSHADCELWTVDLCHECFVQLAKSETETLAALQEAKNAHRHAD